MSYFDDTEEWHYGSAQIRRPRRWKPKPVHYCPIPLPQEKGCGHTPLPTLCGLTMPYANRRGRMRHARKWKNVTCKACLKLKPTGSDR